jgi:hypothetical protein
MGHIRRRARPVVFAVPSQMVGDITRWHAPGSWADLELWSMQRPSEHGTRGPFRDPLRIWGPVFEAPKPVRFPPKTGHDGATLSHWRGALAEPPR